MRIFVALVICVLALGGAHAAPLALAQVATTVNLAQYEPDTIVVSTRERLLFYKTLQNAVVAYRVAVGEESMSWAGDAVVARISEWPAWVPPPEMLKRKPYLPRRIEGGWGNPMGARALYLFEGKRDTYYRIHGTNNSDSIGHAVTSGCIRLLNADVVDLAAMVRVGTKVVVLQ